MNNLSPLSRRAASITILVALVGLGYFTLIYPVTAELDDLDAEMRELGKQLQVLKRVSAKRTIFERKLRKLKQVNGPQQYYLKGSKSTLASAELQQHVRQIVQSVGGQVVSIQVVNKPTKDEPRLVKLKVHMRSDINGLQKTIYSMEAGKPMLFLNNMVVSVSAALWGRSDKNSKHRLLDVHYEVSGYMRELES